MLTKWLITSGLGLAVGLFAASTSLVQQGTAGAKPLDNPEDVQKGEKPNKDDQAKPVEGKIISGNRARQWRDKLDQPVTIEFEPNTPLREALSHIAERYGLTILIDDLAFKVDSDQPDIEAQPVKLPRLASVRLRTVLRAIFNQVNADYYVRDDVFTVVPPQRIQSGAVLRQAVDLDLERRPLPAALKELSDVTGVSIVLDGQKLKDSKSEVTADFRNVPLDCAVRVLADMAGMKSVVMDNLIYVTSVENADKLEEEKAQKEGVAPAKWEKVMPKEKK